MFAILSVRLQLHRHHDERRNHLLSAPETDDQALLDSHRHCLTTRRTLVRGDGSTSHEGIFDLNTGEFPKRRLNKGIAVIRAGLVD
jgi:hypothetical protein